MNIKDLQKFLVLFCLALVAVSCGDKDDPEPSLEEVELAVFSEENKVFIPEGLKNASDSEAQAVSAMIESMTSNIGAYSSLFTIPDGATKLASPIEAVNGRMYTNMVTYEWSYQGGSIAYQITEQDNAYFFEIFFKETGGPYYKWFEGTQAKDGKSGSFAMLDIEAASRVEVFTYEYEIRNDGSIYGEYNYPSFGYSFVFEVLADGSGYIESYENDLLQVEYMWSANGSGSWTYYDESGNVSSSGTWTAG
ncbi:hypothetical protein JMN32_08090 [Fulvivirga sp. 29W222]|uniref:Lipoprotein n=1 Tax=Fulvivirga marina TaxID=2494733 RepID=A0A937FUI1_9BACT|nr:hypothetical protein [Fulvivirga marina]MBL6446264.1 hypothetical protein [Fulvivirga marina]